MIPSLNQIFEQVAHLLVPEATPESLRAHLGTLRDRLDRLKGDAFRRGAGDQLLGLAQLLDRLAGAERDAQAAAGGDADAAQKGRRALLELDALLDRVEDERRWPEIDEDARHRLIWCARKDSGVASGTKRCATCSKTWFREGMTARALRRPPRSTSSVTSIAEPTGRLADSCAPGTSSMPTRRHRWARSSSPCTIGIFKTDSSEPRTTVSTVWWV